MTLLLLTLLTPAEAQPRDAARVQQGEDIAAWRQVDVDDPEQLRAFVEEFPSSRLAARALADLEGGAGVAQPPVVEVETLQVGAQVVDVSQVQVHSERSLSPMVELGWTGTQNAAGMYLYTGVRGDHLGVALRGTAATDGLDLGVAVRGTLWNDQLSPYAELLGEVRDPALGAALGVQQPLRKGFALSLAVESIVVGQQPAPTVRFGAGKAF